MLVQNFSTLCAVFVFVGGSVTLPTQAQDDALKEKLLDVFHPYRQGGPRVEGISSGMKITKENAQVAEKVLPPEILRIVQAGDMEITVQDTSDFPLLPEYIAASIEHSGQAQIGDDGNLQHYTNGLPFPLLDASDPQAGLKAAWNFRHRYLGTSIQTLGTLRSVNSSGGVERGVETRYARLYGMYRLDANGNIPEWEQEGTWWREHDIVLRPQDLEGSQQLTFHHAADTETNGAWVYDPQTRRTRDVVDNLMETSFGLNFLAEDHSGFNGYIHEHTWSYVGEQVMLVPGILKGAPITIGGKNNWYLTVPWELRRIIILDATPKNSSHPYGRRRFYIDRQFFSLFYAVVYDHEGKHWRTLFHCFADPTFDPKNGPVGAPLHMGNIWVDYKSNMASVWTGDEVLVSKPLLPQMFTVKEMVRRGK